MVSNVYAAHRLSYFNSPKLESFHQHNSAMIYSKEPPLYANNARFLHFKGKEEVSNYFEIN